ncbi:MAG TPA: AAA family ATPase [Thermoguttaceae bacterium]|nr:AAA family ATPase [Thermoguttaceae bacterium]
MPDPTNRDLLSRVALGETTPDGTDPFSSLAATAPAEDQPQEQPTDPDAKFASMIERLHELADARRTDETDAAPSPEAEHLKNDFLPIEPDSLEAAGLTDSEVEALILKHLLARGNAIGRDIADQVKLPFPLVEALLWRMKGDQLLVHRASAPMNDYDYQLTDIGREKARRHAVHCTYFGSAPVALDEYVASVHAQSLIRQHPAAEDLHRAFADLVLNKTMLDRLGPAINSSRGLFLFGPPGNGKSSIAERVTAAFGKHIWVPRAITVDGEIIRLFDPVNHDEEPLPAANGLLKQKKIDRRWVRIRRPTIIAGGELTMASLEVTLNRATGISEAPLQMKSNCGVLVIDDFGRQRMSIDELLNRWIVPLEKRLDFLALQNGKKISVPFDQLIIFSTNLEPRDLVDEAFLRRIPYKIEIVDPTEEEFIRLFEVLAPKMGFEIRRAAIEYLIQSHYKRVGRPFRFCQPRDLLLQIRNFCTYYKRPLEITEEHFDHAVDNYFAVM